MPFRWHLGAQFLADFDGGPWHGSLDVLPTPTGEPPACVGVPGDDSDLYMLAGAGEGGPVPYLWIGWARAEGLAQRGVTRPLVVRSRSRSSGPGAVAGRVEEPSGYVDGSSHPHVGGFR